MSLATRQLSRSFLRLKSCTAVFSSRNYIKAAADDPSELSRGDIGKMYHIPLEKTKMAALDKILPRKLQKQMDTLDECALLVRSQFLEVIHCFKAVRTTFPSIRVVLWGKFGTGKTTTLAEAVHYAHTQNWVIFNVKDVMDWTRAVLDVHMSTFKHGRIDLPQHAVSFLQHFKQQNQHVWKKLTELKTEKMYEFSKVDKVLEDRPLIELVELGIASPIYASDCIGILGKELRRHATSGEVKLLVAMDGANSLYGKTMIKKADRSMTQAHEISLIHHMKQFFNDDWTNGLVLMIADKREISDARDELAVPMDTPIELFGEEGFEDIDPFIPIETQLYTENEARTVHGYYKDKNWLTSENSRSEAGLKQFYYLSAFNPYYFERLCAFN